MSLEIRWATAFLDIPALAFETAVRFWQAVTGSGLSDPRGDDGRFATLIPPDGDPYLRVQRVDSGRGGCHLDLHVDDVDQAARTAVDLGAAVRFAEPGLVVLTDPGGFAFCVVEHRPDVEMWPPAPLDWPGGRSQADQLCLDIPAPSFDRSVQFWTDLTGWPLRPPGVLPEYRNLTRPPGQPLRLLLQRIGEDTGPSRAHLDLAADDVPEEVERHVILGAAVLRTTEYWTTLLDPAGREYCITSRRL